MNSRLGSLSFINAPQAILVNLEECFVSFPREFHAQTQRKGSLSGKIDDQSRDKGKQMYKNILVPVALDHGGRADQALKVASQLLTQGGKIQLLHVTEPVPGYVAPHIPDQILAQNRTEVSEGLAALVTRGGGAVESHTATGHAGTAIIEFAADNGVDCIVIASHRPEISDYFLGSTAARVVRHAPCCVHVIR